MRIWKIAIRQIQNAVSRPRGRPPIRFDDDTRDLIIEAARQEFRANGYAATCMNTVPQRSGITPWSVLPLRRSSGDALPAQVSPEPVFVILRLGEVGVELALQKLGEFALLIILP